MAIHRLVLWGPGQVGRAVLRAALADPRFDVIAVKARKERPDGIHGVPVVTTRQDVLDLAPDCVVLTPGASTIFRGLDDDVIALLEAGINVVSTVAYHSPAARNWASSQRATAAQLLEACQHGGATLHGTGVHPTFMVERVVLTLAQALDEVDHIRFVEAADFSGAPDTMWGGLSALGLGQPLEDLTDDHPVACGGDLYYGDVITNVAEALWGAGPDDVRVERSFRGVPADRDVTVAGTPVVAGTAGAVHLVHRGYLDDRLVFTNEECWYLRDACTYRGDDLPFGGFQAGASYTAEITGQPAALRTQIEFDPIGHGTDPITTGSVRAVLAAIIPVCEANPGVLVDDVRPRYRPATTIRYRAR